MDSAQSTTRIILAHGHPFFMSGIKSFLDRQPDLEVQACCKDGEEVLEAIGDLVPDIAILDLALQPLSGVAVHQTVAERGLPTRIVVLSSNATCPRAREAAATGVAGIVLSDAAPEHLLDCIRTVMGGGQQIPPETVESLRDAKAPAMQTLSYREKEVAQLASKGLSNREISDKLGISLGTVKVHLHNIYQKIEISSRSALIILYNSINNQ